MAGTTTEKRIHNLPAPANPLVNKVIITWTSDASGAATATIQNVNGVIQRIVTKPGSPAPTDNYTVKLNDESGIDVLAGQGTANRDTANSEHFCPGVALNDGTTTSVVPVSVCGDLSLVISGAGSAKAGTFTIYFR